MQYEVEMHHSEESFEALAHMQYNLFCGKNRAARSFISLALVLVGIVNFSSWWGILIMAYGCYLTTSTYSSANHTAHKLADQVRQSGMPFPASRYRFRKNAMEVVPLPEGKERETLLPYSEVYRLGEDLQYYYIFRDQYGGYMIPKAALGDQSRAFRTFLEGRCGQKSQSRSTPLSWLMRKLRDRDGHSRQL